MLSNNRRITRDEIEYNLLNLKQLTFEVTDDCNLQCKYCGYGDLYYGYDKRDKQYMTFAQAKIVIDYLTCIWKSKRTDSEAPTTYISFYGGEPLMNIELIKKVISYVKSLNIKRTIIFSMTTNAVLLDKYIEFLIANKVNLLISLDGDEYGHSYRIDKGGNNSFLRVFNNIKTLQKKYPDYFENCVNFNSVLHNRNSVKQTHDFIFSEFGKVPTISELNNSEIRTDKKEEFLRTYRNKMESLVNSENYEKISEEMFLGDPSTDQLLLYLHNYSGNVFYNYNSLLNDESKITYTPTGTCSPFAKKLFVTVKGKILQCERIDHKFNLGSIKDDKVELNFEDISNKFNRYLEKMQLQCGVCYKKQNCTQCLYYILDIDEERPRCIGFMNKEQFTDYQSFCLGFLKERPKLYRQLMEDVLID